jgi:hypothetical protein
MVWVEHGYGYSLNGNWRHNGTKWNKIFEASRAIGPSNRLVLIEMARFGVDEGEK